MNRSTPWIIALLLSVLVNGAMLGVTLHSVSDGPWMDHRRGDGEGPRGMRGDGFSVRGFLSALPPEYRDEAQERLRARRDEVLDEVRLVREAQAHVEQVLLREPFEPDALRAALGELRRARGSMESEVETAIIDILAELPPETRLRALQNGMRRDARRGGPPDDHRRPPPPGE